MEHTGHITRWDSTRGFGFIRSADVPADVFFHARDFGGAPVVGIAVRFELIHVGGKGPRAMAVKPTNAPPRAAVSSRAKPATPSPTQARTPSQPARRHTPAQRQPGGAAAAPAGQALAIVLMLLWLGLLGWGLLSQHLPLWLLGAAVALNLVTFVAYAMDKSAAQNGSWRISEQPLHLLALLGGWPAAWWAQQWLRHKSRKTEFRSVYWATVLLHCAALALLLTRWPGLLQRF